MVHRPTIDVHNKFFQSILGLSTGILDLFAGAILFLAIGILSKYPWAPLLIPPLLSFRGSVMGIFIGRVSTELHLGTIQPSITKNTRYFYSLLISTYILRIYGIILITILLYIISILKYRIPVYIHEILLLFIAVMEISFIMIFSTLMIISNKIYHLGIDPDYTLYPIGSSISDIITNLIFIVLLYLIYLTGEKAILLIFPVISYFILILLVKEVGYDIDVIKKTVFESLISLTIVCFIVALSSIFFKELTLLALSSIIYLIYPSFITIIGDAGSIFGSTITTKLHIGDITMKRKDISKFLRILIPIFSAYIIMNIIISFYPTLIGYPLINSIINILPRILIAGFMGLIIGVLIVLFINKVTFEVGLDPDHFINPIISTLSDNIGTISLFIVFGIFPA